MSSCSPYFGLGTSKRFPQPDLPPRKWKRPESAGTQTKTGGPPIRNLPDGHKYLCQRGRLHAAAFTLRNEVGPAALARTALF